MNFDDARLYEALNDIHARPAPFSVDTVRDLWDDDHVSERMLAFHLDPEAVPASRPHAFIDRSAAWIGERFGLAAGRRVADFGCGPGLYASRFAAAGAAVTGLDFSRRSLAHARAEAARLGLQVDYVLGDYLEFRSESRFDLITMIYCDFCALSPDRRRRLLDVFREHLAEGGSVLLDVWSPRAYAGRTEDAEHGFRLMDGFWAPGDYWGFRDTFKYDAEKVVLDKYTIVEPRRIRRIYNWLQYYTPEALAAEFAAAGLRVVESHGDVAGSKDGDGDVIAVVAQRA